MSVSVRGHERAVEVLKEKGALPKGISDNITKGIPEKVKEILKPEVPKPEEGGSPADRGKPEDKGKP